MSGVDLGRIGWRKSSYSVGRGECIEIDADSGNAVGIRDSKNPDGPVLAIPRRGFAALIRRQQQRN